MEKLENYYETRIYTNNIIDYIEDNNLSAKNVLRNLMEWMDEDDVKQFAIDELEFDDVDDGRDVYVTLNSVEVFLKDKTIDNVLFSSVEQQIQAYLPKEFDLLFDDYFVDELDISNEIEEQFKAFLESEGFNMEKLGIVITDDDWEED